MKNKKKNIALIFASCILFLALFDGWPYAFFTILRFVVFVTTVYVAYGAYREQKELWVWILGSVAILFNPFIPIYLTREVWLPIDFFVGTLLLSTIFLLKLKN